MLRPMAGAYSLWKAPGGGAGQWGEGVGTGGREWEHAPGWDVSVVCGAHVMQVSRGGVGEGVGWAYSMLC